MSNCSQLAISLARVLWNYLILNQPLEHSDCILVFGGHDSSVAIHAANLYIAGWADTIIVSGGVTHPCQYYGLTKDCIEAEALKAVLVREGIKEKDILLETKAKNTSENFWFTRDLLFERNLDYSTFILVQKPYTERRTYLTGLNRWPDKRIIVSSLRTSFDQYLNGNIEQEKIINMMTGEIYRLCEYPKLGYFEQQLIPENVMQAYENLLKMGFNERIK